MVVTQHQDEESRHYQVIGQVFFASADQFVRSFDFKEAQDKVVIDLTRAHFWDITAISALDKVVVKFKRLGTAVEVVGISAATQTLIDKFSIHNDPEAVEKMLAG